MRYLDPNENYDVPDGMAFLINYKYVKIVSPRVTRWHQKYVRKWKELWKPIDWNIRTNNWPGFDPFRAALDREMQGIIRKLDDKKYVTYDRPVVKYQYGRLTVDGPTRES